MSAAATTAEFVKARDLAERLGLSYASVCRALKGGEITAIKVGQQWLIHQTVVEDLVARARGERPER